MKLLPIYGGLSTLVDDEDFKPLSKFKWHLSKRKGIFFYVVRSKRIDSKHSIKIYLHREIMKASKNQQVDHRDRNVLNNQKTNLRFCTKSQNMANRRSPLNSKRKFRGVHQVRNRWFAAIKTNRKVTSLGGFPSEVEAAKAYDNAAIKIHGEFALLNLGQNVHALPANGSKI